MLIQVFILYLSEANICKFLHELINLYVLINCVQGTKAGAVGTIQIETNISRPRTVTV